MHGVYNISLLIQEFPKNMEVSLLLICDLKNKPGTEVKGFIKVNKPYWRWMMI